MELLEVAVENVQALPNEEYALARKDGFGASDASVLLGVNLYKDLDVLLREKRNKFLTDEEKAVGDKPAVRKGRDLEEIILKKAEKALGIPLEKPKDMYRFKEHPALTINFDGVGVIDGIKIPVEAKLVTKWGEKYYNKDISPHIANLINMTTRHATIEGHIKFMADQFGIPAYYYAQVQQEIAALDAPYGYLAAMFDDSWTLKLYKIMRDDFVISKIYVIAEDLFPKIKELQ